MPTLYIVGGGLFGSQAAAYARSKGIEAIVLDGQLEGRASPAAAGLFKQEWAGVRYGEHFQRGLGVLESLYGIQTVPLRHDDGRVEPFLCVPPTVILEREPVRHAVEAVGDGWLEAGGVRYEGWVYVAAGVWSDRFLPGLRMQGRAGASLSFPSERPGRIRELAYGRQALAFVREPGLTHFSDGTAELVYTEANERATEEHAQALGLTEAPVARHWGRRPYTPGGPVFVQLGSRTWLATGGRKMGTILGASFAKRLVDEELA
jgi:glycine/D-amino acid oxidase-like deaminating enzyme